MTYLHSRGRRRYEIRMSGDRFWSQALAGTQRFVTTTWCFFLPDRYDQVDITLSEMGTESPLHL